jgi:hypothetical protein
MLGNLELINLIDVMASGHQDMLALLNILGQAPTAEIRKSRHGRMVIEIKRLFLIYLSSVSQFISGTCKCTAQRLCSGWVTFI